MVAKAESDLVKHCSARSVARHIFTLTQKLVTDDRAEGMNIGDLRLLILKFFMESMAVSEDDADLSEALFWTSDLIEKKYFSNQPTESNTSTPQKKPSETTFTPSVPQKPKTISDLMKGLKKHAEPPLELGFPAESFLTSTEDLKVVSGLEIEELISLVKEHGFGSAVFYNGRKYHFSPSSKKKDGKRNGPICWWVYPDLSQLPNGSASCPEINNEEQPDSIYTQSEAESASEIDNPEINNEEQPVKNTRNNSQVIKFSSPPESFSQDCLRLSTNELTELLGLANSTGIYTRLNKAEDGIASHGSYKFCASTEKSESFNGSLWYVYEEVVDVESNGHSSSKMLVYC